MRGAGRWEFGAGRRSRGSGAAAACLTCGEGRRHGRPALAHPSRPSDPTSAPRPFVVVRGGAPALAALKGGVVAIGNFDGVHRGHRTVIAAAVRRAAALGGPAVALTFEPHPRRFLRPEAPLFRLTDETNKLR